MSEEDLRHDTLHAESAEPEYDEEREIVVRTTSPMLVGSPIDVDEYPMPDYADTETPPGVGSHLLSKESTMSTRLHANGGVRDVRIQAVLDARAKGYEGDACTECGAMTMVRNGSCLKCVSCGSTSGCS